MIRLSAQLDPNDGVMIDISPATRGNTPNAPFTESYDQVGYAVNPYTGQPYEPQMAPPRRLRPRDLRILGRRSAFDRTAGTLE